MASASVAAPPAKPLSFKPIETPADLHREIAIARRARKPIMLWVRADWAMSGVEMEQKTFTNPDVMLAATDLVLLRADVTNFDSEDKMLLAELDLSGAPVALFYGVDGTEQRNFRVHAFMKAAAFAAMIRAASAQTPHKTP